MRKALSLVAFIVALMAGTACAGGPGATGQAIQQRFGGEVVARGATDGQALIWQASTGTWVPGSGGTSIGGSNAAGAVVVGTGSGFSGTVSGALKAQTITFPTNGGAACGLTFQDTGAVAAITYPSAVNCAIDNGAGSKLTVRNSNAGVSMEGLAFLMQQATVQEFTGRSKISSAADGNVTITDNAGTGMTSLILGTVGDYQGTGSPEGVVTAGGGSTYRNTATTGAAPFFYKVGTGNTGWAAVSSATGATSGLTGQTTVTTGDLLYGSAANTWSKLGAGTSGYVLTANGAGVAPSWQAAAGGGFNPAAATAITFASGNSIQSSTSGELDIYGANGPSAGTAGISIWLAGGNGNTTGSGGTATLQGGAGGSSGTGGGVNIIAGDGGSGTSGGVYVEAGFAAGTDVAGADIDLAAGAGTGAAAPGAAYVRVASPKASGTSGQNNRVKRAYWPGKRVTLTDNTATTIATQNVSTSGSVGGFRVTYRVRVSDGTDYQCYTGTVPVAAVNKAGTVTAAVPATLDAARTDATIVSGGTLTVVPSVTVSSTTVSLKLTADTSLTATTFDVCYSIINESDFEVAIP